MPALFHVNHIGRGRSFKLKNITHVLFILLSCFFSFQSCTPKIKSVDIPPLPETTPKISDAKDCMVQDRILIETQTLFKNKKYKKALNRASQILKNPCSKKNYVSTLEIIGDIFVQRQEIVNGFQFYAEAIENSDEKNHKTRILEKMVSVAFQEKPEQVIFLISKIRSAQLQGEILYKTGLEKFKAGKDKETLVILKKFTNDFKDHDQSLHAGSIMKTIQERYAFHSNRIGVLLPLSGYYKVAGERALSALTLAIETVNKSNSQKSFRLIIRDTESDPQSAIQGLRELAAQKVACIIGPMVTAQQAGLESNKRKIPMVTMTQKPDIPGIGDYIFRNWFTPRMQVEACIAYFVEELGLANFAILYPDENYGQAFKNAFEEMVPYYNGKITDSISYTPGDTDFLGQISALIRGYETRDEQGVFVDMDDNEIKERNKIYKAKVDFDVLFIPDSPAMLGMIAPQLRYYDIDRVLLMGTNLWHSDKLLESAKEFVQNAVFPDGFDQKKESPRVHHFVTAFEGANEALPEYIEATAYDTALLVMNTLSLPYVRSKKEFVSALKTTTFKEGVTCPVSFDTSGEMLKNLDLYTVKANKIVLFKPCNE